MAGIEIRERTAATRIDRVQDTLKAGGLVDGLAEGVGSGELQAMRKAFIKGYLQRVVGRIRDRILRKDAAEYGNAIRGAAVSGERIALGRRVFA